MRNRWKTPILVAVLTVVAAACGGGEAGGDGGGTGAECTSTIKVGVAYDVGGLGDQSFNDAAKAGLDKALEDGLVCEENTVVNEANSDGSNRDQNVQALADGGFDLVVAVGFLFSPGVNKIAPDYPDTNFMIVDGYATCGTGCGLTNEADAIPNVADYSFREQEGSFLVGAAAALKCECDTIGFLGGQISPLIAKFEAGYTAGAKAVDPGINVLVEYIGDTAEAFNNDPAGEAKANKMYDEGADVVYHAAGGSGLGLFRAAAAQQKWAIGVDSDQYLLASPEQQPWILTSMIKRVDTAVYEAIKAVGDGTFEGNAVFGLADDGVGYATSNPELTSDITEQLETYKAQIISGEIVVPETP